MLYKIRYLPEAAEDVRHLPPDLKRLVKAALDELSKNPHAGTPLVRDLAGLWKYRAKRYRIIYKVTPSKKEIIVFLIDARESVYDYLREVLKSYPMGEN